MYLRELEGEARTFGVSGKLWHGVLVMFDRESDTLWTQLDGRAIQGADRGSRLAHWPSTFTTWEAWVDAHPDTLVLAKEGEARDRSRYADYFADPGRLFLDRLGEGLGDLVEPKEVVFGLRLGDEALAVTEELLVRQEVLNVEVGGRAAALVRDPRTGGVRAFDRGEGAIEFGRGREGDEVRLIEASSGRRLDPADFEPLRVDRAYWYAWKRSHPASRVRR